MFGNESHDYCSKQQAVLARKRECVPVHTQYIVLAQPQDIELFKHWQCFQQQDIVSKRTLFQRQGMSFSTPTPCHCSVQTQHIVIVQTQSHSYCSKRRLVLCQEQYMCFQQQGLLLCQQQQHIARYQQPHSVHARQRDTCLIQKPCIVDVQTNTT